LNQTCTFKILQLYIPQMTYIASLFIFEVEKVRHMISEFLIKTNIDT